MLAFVTVVIVITLFVCGIITIPFFDTETFKAINKKIADKINEKGE